MQRFALIVGHGQPSDPDGPERDMAALAAAVAGRLPGWQVRGTTLAAPGALERALAGAQAPVVVPVFMADGWFTASVLPDRLSRAGHAGARQTAPIGLWPGLVDLAAARITDSASARGWPVESLRLILVAHGSRRGDRPARATAAVADQLAGRLSPAEIRLGFVEQAPRLAEALAGAPPRSICLPLFAARWGHVLDDLPAALAETAFPGIVLPPIGTDPAVPGLIARHLSALAADSPPAG